MSFFLIGRLEFRRLTCGLPEQMFGYEGRKIEESMLSLWVSTLIWKANNFDCRAMMT
jgi:hypothetical protein